MFDLSPIHLLLALAICLIVAGPKRLPDLGRSLGRGMREFRATLGGLDTDQLPSQATPPIESAPTSDRS